MSFGGGGFGGGFGQQNNQQTSGFGGFGQSNNTTGGKSAAVTRLTPSLKLIPRRKGFGSGSTGGFGQTNNNNTGGGGLFGGATSSNTGGGFGASSSLCEPNSFSTLRLTDVLGGGFGSNTNSAFGSKPAFGSSTTGGGMFGSNTANTNTGTSGFGGGFGGTSNTTNTSTPFGGGSTGGGLFGGGGNTAASKPAFGATGTTGNSLFGGGSATTNTTSSFGGGGFGATNNQTGDPPGTAVTPFQAHNEKESATSAQSNAFQNILFQDAYKKWSADELRLADYAQGRRHGNGSGGGAFGVSSGFGGSGFGSGTNTASTGGGLFGSGNNTNTNNNAAGGGLFGSGNNTNTTTGFGQSNTGFGANNNTANAAGGGGLFGAKPSGGGLFGNSQNQQSGFGGNTGGGFGAGASTGTGFGAANTGTATGGGGLFGSNNQAASKPAGGLFGNASNTNTTGFGGATNTGFGASASNTGGGGLFGNNNQQQQSGGGGLFGNNNNAQQQGQQQNTGNAFGGFGQQNQNQAQQGAGGGLFGNSQQKPAGGLFGSSTPNTGAAGGGLFGNANNQQQPQTGGFGQNNANTGGGLFGNKPAATGGLFGQSNTQASSTGGGLFGNANNAQPQQTGGGGLFGSAANNQQQKPGMFGNSTQNSGGLFGAQNNQTQGSSLFGGSTNQQQQSQGMANSLLGNSQQANSAPQGLTANLNDVSAYGSPSLFSNAGGSEVANPGPLATPVSGNSKPKRGSILPLYKLAPSSASRFATPQKRGFGFSYSTYGTPGSPASSIGSTPGTQGRSLLGASSSGSLSKSMSTNNLRRNFNTEDSILAPGAFSSSSGPRWYGSTGSKKLVISRDMRNDLFSTPQKDRQLTDASSNSRKLSKRVSFDTSNVDSGEEPEIRGALPAPESSPAAQADDTPRQNRAVVASNGSLTPEADKSNGELNSVQEEENLTTPGRISHPSNELAPGAYWTQPTLEELKSMNRVQRQKIDGFEIGREHVGSIKFLYPVDISGIEVDDLCGTVIQLELRSATVYPVAAKKPPVGKGLNVPAQITLEQSWPRGNPTDARRLKKHVDRLKRMEDTQFIKYDELPGIWVFTVEHFTTYGLDDSEDDSDADMQPTDPPADDFLSDSQQLALDASLGSTAAGDDTFEFRRSRGLPGAFDEPDQMLENDLPPQQSFFGISSVDSTPNDVRLSLEAEQYDDTGVEYDMSDDEDLTRSYAGQHHATEHDDDSSEDEQDIKRGTPGGILRARMRAVKDTVGPVQLEVADGDDWAVMLRKTVSPGKRDRQFLKQLGDASPSRQIGHAANAGEEGEYSPRKSSVWRKSAVEKKDGLAAIAQPGQDKGRGFATSIDLMHSLFEKPKPAAQSFRASTTATKGFPQVGAHVF